jgi:PAS domain S-box-containing protein
MRASEQIALQAQLLDEVDAAVILLDVATQPGVISYWSAGAQRLYGYTKEEAVGRTLIELVMTDQSRKGAECHWEPVMRGESVADELELRDKHGRVFPAAVSLRLVSESVEAGSSSVITV